MCFQNKPKGEIQMKNHVHSLRRILALCLLCLTLVSLLPLTAGAAARKSSLQVRFLDVGQADSALILCDGKAMLIDGGNAEDSSLLYAVLKKQKIDYLDYVVGTHAHEDHIGGLSGALSYADVGNIYCPTDSYDSKAFRNFIKAVQKRNCKISIPEAGDHFSLGSAECRILAVNTDPEDPNNASIVLRVTYGETSFLFTGDGERETEQAILNSGEEIQSTVLKVGHHGSDSSTTYRWLRQVDPEYAVISVGKDNSYGHPTEELLSRLRDADVKTFRTDLQGDILFESDGKQVSVTVSKNKDADVFGGIGKNSTQKQTEPAPAAPADTGRDYVANKNTKKFHYPTCYSAGQIKASNRWDFHGTREELVGKGYVPCKKCTP